MPLPLKNFFFKKKKKKNLTSNQIGLLAEFKHINKRRKRK
jgi:hypothetical protein